MDESGVPGEDHRPVASHWQNVSHSAVSSTPRHEQDFNSQLIAEIDVNPPTISSRQRRPPFYYKRKHQMYIVSLIFKIWLL